jgi:hypothetical protein
VPSHPWRQDAALRSGGVDELIASIGEISGGEIASEVASDAEMSGSEMADEIGSSDPGTNTEHRHPNVGGGGGRVARAFALIVSRVFDARPIQSTRPSSHRPSGRQAVRDACDRTRHVSLRMRGPAHVPSVTYPPP